MYRVPGAFFYEVLVPHLVGMPFRDAVDAAPDEAKECTSSWVDYKEAAGTHTTVFECLRCLFRRLDFDEALVTRIFSRIFLRTLSALKLHVEKQLSLRSALQPVLESDVLTIELACRWTQQKVKKSQALPLAPPFTFTPHPHPHPNPHSHPNPTLTPTPNQVFKDFPLASDGDTGDENWLMNEKAHTQAEIVKELARKLPLTGGRAEEMPRLSNLQLSVPFKPFDGFELALDSDPFKESGAGAQKDKSSSALLNLQLRWRHDGKPGEDFLREEGEALMRDPPSHDSKAPVIHKGPVIFAEMLDVLQNCKATCDELRYGHHALGKF